MKNVFLKYSCFLSFVLFLMSCSSSAIFNQKAYEQTTSLKVDALTLMDKAIEPYANHQAAIDGLKLNMEKAYQYCKGLPNNDETIKQWEIIIDPNRNSLMGFVHRWETQKQLKLDFINDVKGLVSDGFDAVIELESGKRKPTN